MNTILSIETSTAACSVALLHQGEITEIFEMLPQKHAQRVLEMVDEILSQTKVTPAQIDYLAFGEGPGAFTGIRIAAGVVQGLALGWDKPVIGVSSLEAMAHSGIAKQTSGMPEESIQWIALMDARMQEIYLQRGEYDPNNGIWQSQSPVMLNESGIVEQLKRIPDFKNSAAYGDILDSYPDITALFDTWNETLPTASSVARLADLKPDTAKLISEEVPLPVYLRNNVAETIEQRRAKAN
ncbi:tRNA (adenosine(37)-N6)-threonylcarbamoyltransferase complex dimerization subunit type 1 TsaB [Thiomicrorhabdus sp. ZW0627]|uniref:tRNA (adenosine(37)-N6)-threonylcarbamoyltransferase complex dimerization subunit type 1 TsaB n=1 Tax=Thiomicrorhabdus sp. ZW0627 TaxID=3039774 RepID=UPI002436B39D|nr:tRNA (adenosine(37)-N6)-threonylcarbamoyltransferase complex dimerization subunit type 1 TsaB [Thiomicrorhabdus sp. ZW0627]MDG6772987.1 tRNA (adenosine(37)-N6)-threonylcarbamoyltransferase complex dimerization subunit type 1 TsaB [Thiomicrorhabdus sp. ZW0627]